MSHIDNAISLYREDGLTTLLSRSTEFFRENGVLFSVARATKLSVAKGMETVIGKRWIGKFGLLTALYFYFRGTFRQEQQAVLRGHVQYESGNQEGGPLYKVIRDTHRIEKGLSMRNRRDVFAEGYVTELVNALEQCVSETDELDRQVEWSVDVLHEYFSTVEHTDPIAKAHQQFEEIRERLDYEPGNKNPTQRAEIEVAPTSYNSLRKLAKQRRSTRWFEQRPVPRDEIDKALEIAALSPSACNRQPFEFRIYTDDDVIDEITNLPLGVRGYEHNIPALVVLVGKQRAYFDERDKNIIYIDASLAAMSFQFALETLGLASTCINWPVVPESKRTIRDIIPMDPDEQIVMLMAIGYPSRDGKVPYSEKKPLKRIRSYNE